jgi:hypothetical protein
MLEATLGLATIIRRVDITSTDSTFPLALPFTMTARRSRPCHHPGQSSGDDVTPASTGSSSLSPSPPANLLSQMKYQTPTILVH